MAFSEDELKSQPPKESAEAARLRHVAKHVKLMCIRLHNKWLKKNVPPEELKRRLIDGERLEQTMTALRHVYHNIRWEKRSVPSKLYFQLTTEAYLGHFRLLTKPLFPFQTAIAVLCAPPEEDE